MEARVERRYRDLYDRAPLGLFRATLVGRLIEANQAFAELLGFSSVADLLADRTADVWADAHQVERWRTALESGSLVPGVPLTLRRRDGGLVLAEVSARAGRDAEGRLAWIDGVVGDVTARRRVESALRASEAMLGGVVTLAMDAIVAVDDEQRVVLFNQAAERMFGCRAGDALGQPLDRFLPSRHRDAHRRFVEEFGASGASRRTMGRLGAVTGLRASGEEFPVEASICRIALEGGTVYAAILRDITHRLRVEAALRQSEKLASLGQLLAGVAHELNNPLSVIVGNAELLGALVEPGPLADRVEGVLRAADRCTRIVKSFVALARERAVERKPVALASVVREGLGTVAYQLAVDGVEVGLDLPESLPHVPGDARQLQQVVVNLLTNGHQAVRDQAGPRRLRVAARHDPEAGRVVLEVADTGPGVPADLRQRIFEPFFTTRPPGQGTGLGLSLCATIVQEHGGEIVVDDDVGGGARFRVELPVAGEGAVASDPASEETVPGAAILVVDDEPAVMDLLARVLAGDGHRVETAASGAEALARIESSRFDLVMTDMRMPGMDGAGLYREIERRRPDLARRVVLLTGDVLSPDTEAFLARTRLLSLAKPFRLGDVRRVTAEALAR